MNFESYKIADLNLAKRGRLELELAENEMPGLMELRREFRDSKPLKGARISGSLGVTIQTAIFLETLKELGAEMRWSSSNESCTDDSAAAALVEANTAGIFARKGESTEDYWWCIYQSLIWENDQVPNLLVDDGGELLNFINVGLELEKEYEISGTFPDPNIDIQVYYHIDMHNLLIKVIPANKRLFHRIVESVKGLCEETTTGTIKLRKLAKENKLLFPVINVNDAITKTKFDNLYGCRHSLPDGLSRATDVLIAGKKVVVCGFGDVGKGSALAMKAAGARVYVSEIDPICALQACMEGYHVAKVESVLDADIFITATGNKSIINVNHMKKMKNNAICCNIGTDNIEIDLKRLKDVPGMKIEKIKPLLDRYVFPDGHGVIVPANGEVINLSNATGHPSFIMSISFSNQVLGLIEMWENRDTMKYKKEVYFLPKNLDEKIAKLHLKFLGAELTELTEEQASYIGVSKSGPFKKDNYRY